MSPRSTEQSPRRFLTDRMLGTLTRYLRFMGYDTMSANSLSPGNTRKIRFSSISPQKMTGSS
ncbi:Mut7-C RNAse domain-containing protein [Methanoculleus bourgensis]|uniref:Mut7-C RNAse domain-containing protein n=1 Tax=Methanoculleus bourgensis TaxID=83986 RepID=A0A0X3BQT4_9EURY|nr:protein of unknown function [Methanoculleus bourgensis]